MPSIIFLLFSFSNLCALKKNTFNYFNASSEVYKSTIYHQLKFSIFETCVILTFEALADFYAFLIWAGPNERVQELCFDMLCRIFTQVFFPPLLSLIWRGHCVHMLGSHKAGIVGVVCGSLRRRPASGRKDSTASRAQHSRAGYTLCVYIYAVPLCASRADSDSRTCGTDQLAGWFKTFDSWPASAMVISFEMSIEKIQ